VAKMEEGNPSQVRTVNQSRAALEMDCEDRPESSVNLRGGDSHTIASLHEERKILGKKKKWGRAKEKK